MARKCFWCQTTYLPEREALSDNPMITLHEKCFEDIMSVHSKIERAVDYLEGRLPRLRKDGDQVGYDTIEQTLKAMDDFDKKWARKMKILKGVLKG